MISIENKEHCCGCTACYNICPTKAIIMKADDKGFRYPEVINEKCIQCNLCERVCRFRNNNSEDETESPKIMVLQHFDNDVLRESSSGGAFTALSDLILKMGGYVIGAVMSDEFIVQHSIANTESERNEMRRSKYVESSLGNVFQEILPIVKKGFPVLFTGTPCQVDGFRSFLVVNNVNMDNVFLCGLVCHGAASPVFWDHYIKFVAQSEQVNIDRVNFRDKEMGWRNSLFIASEGEKRIALNSYSLVFGMCLSNRQSCFSCPYTTINRKFDFTLGDFWTINQYIHDLPEEKGVSLVLTHSDKARRLLNECKEYARVQEVDLDVQSELLHPALRCPYKKPIEYELFWKDFATQPMGKVIKKYTGRSVGDKFRRKIRKCYLNIEKYVLCILKGGK